MASETKDTTTAGETPFPKLTFAPADGPALFLPIAKELVDHLMGKFTFRSVIWDSLCYDPSLIASGVTRRRSGKDAQFVPGGQQQSYELYFVEEPKEKGKEKDKRDEKKAEISADVQKGIDNLKKVSGRCCRGQPLREYSLRLSAAPDGSFWAFALHNAAACRLPTVWALLRTVADLPKADAKAEGAIPFPPCPTTDDSSPLVDKVHFATRRRDIPDFGVGDTLRVQVMIVEGDKERAQAFTGTVIARNGSGIAENITLRRVSYGQGVERVFPLHSPRLAKVEVLKHGRVRRSKLYYLRAEIGKAARVQEDSTATAKAE